MENQNSKNIVTISYEIDNCIDCKFHKIIPDPDPNDSFCADDVAIICLHKRKESDEIKSDSIYAVDRQEYKHITVGCRPYNKRKESNIPDWCRLLNSEK